MTTRRNEDSGIELSITMIRYNNITLKHCSYGEIFNTQQRTASDKIHQAVEKMVESLDLAAGSTSNFDLYQVVESYFKDLEKRRKINHVLGIKEDRYEFAEDFGIK